MFDWRLSGSEACLGAVMCAGKGKRGRVGRGRLAPRPCAVGAGVNRRVRFVPKLKSESSLDYRMFDGPLALAVFAAARAAAPVLLAAAPPVPGINRTPIGLQENRRIVVFLERESAIVTDVAVGGECTKVQPGCPNPLGRNNKPAVTGIEDRYQAATGINGMIRYSPSPVSSSLTAFARTTPCCRFNASEK